MRLEAWWAILPLAWLVGTIPFSYLLPRWATGQDVRAVGSGNVGATNASRAAGRVIGALCFLLDGAKGALAVVLTIDAGASSAGAAAAGLLAILGHGLSPWLRGAGGKGVSTAAGALLALTPAWAAIVVMTWGVVLALTRTVSAASIAAAVALPLVLAIGASGLFPRQPVSGPVVAFGGFAGVWIVFRHRENLARLRAGTEPRIGALRT
ncbi:MAG: glycerol-3-phosphate acyltransferase [Candidatus Sericytochromatia bacterium]|nr:glycerol-3-phosphate acyltransferase [Candidatus Sericytochromatia bacterium]